MKKKSAMGASEFFNLSKTQQAKELKKMTKRANVRLSLLEEKESITLAYRQAYQYNINQERENNRFYEGTKYKSSAEIKEAYQAVTNFLGNKSSTLHGVEDNVRDTIESMVQHNKIDENVIKKMNHQEQRYASKYIAQASNKKLKDLEKSDIHQYAYAMAGTYNKADGRDKNRFYRGIKFKNDEELRTHLENMTYFFNAKTSTKKGYDESISSRLDKFREKGVYIPHDKEYEFFQFLASEEFKKLGARASSKQVMKTYAEARNIGNDVDEMNELFKEFLDTDMTFDQVQEKLGTAKWLFKKPVIYL